MIRVLVVAEHDGTRLAPATAKCVRCALDLKAEALVVAVLADGGADVAAQAARLDGVTGVVLVDAAHNAVPLAAVLAPQIATAIENARLYERVARNEARLERDLKAARDLQRNLLAAASPEFSGIDIAGRNVGASEVTGDLFDFFPFGESHLNMLLGDVSGKGAAAALYGALASGLLRNVMRERYSPAELLGKTNEALLARRIEARYLTAVAVQWKPASHEVVIANAGQPRPVICRGGKVEIPAISGVPLGLIAGTEYENLTLPVEAGDLIVLVSDGITEATDRARVQYGDERLPQVVEAHSKASASDLLDTIFNDVSMFAAGGRQDDDRTVIVAKITE